MDICNLIQMNSPNPGLTECVNLIYSVNEVYEMKTQDQTQMKPPPGSRVRRKQDARREAILKTALRLGAEEGRAGLAINRIAEELDYTPGALYRYFESKDALLAELQNYAQTEILHAYLNKMQEWSEKGKGETGALFLILAASDFYMDLRRTLPEHAALIGLIVGDPRNFQAEGETDRLMTSAKALFSLAEGMFSQAQEAGALPKGSARERALIFWSTLHGATQIWKLDRVEPGLKEPRYYGVRAAKALLLGWGADAKMVDKAWRMI